MRKAATMGDPHDPFSRWLQKNRELVLSVAQLTGDSIPSMSMEDVEQELSLSCWKARKHYDPARSTYTTYARTTMEHRVRELARRAHAKKREGDWTLVSLDAQDKATRRELEEQMDLPPVRDPADIVADRMRLDMAAEVLSTFPARKQRWIRDLVRGYTQAEVAKGAHVTQSCVSICLRDFRQALREREEELEVL